MVIGLFGVAIAFTVSTLDPFIYNEKVRLLAPAGFKNTTLGFITIMALIVALAAQPIVGQWSDRTESHWGKRIPFLTVGVIGLSLTLTLVIIADTLWLLVIAAMLVSCFSNTIQAAWQALIPDYVSEFQRGKAAGIKTVMEIIGIVAGVVTVGYFMSQGNLWGTPLMAIALSVVILGITFFTLKDIPPKFHSSTTTNSQNLIFTLVSSLKQAPPSFIWWMVNRFLFWSSATAIRTFLLNYLEDVMGMTPAYAQSLSSQLFLVLGLGVFTLALPAGAIADKIGRRPILFTAGILAAMGTLPFIFSRDLIWLIVGGAFIAVGTGIFASASWALATDLAPAGKGALYLGLANGAGVVGSIGGRLGGPVIDGINQTMGTIAWGYMVVFSMATLFFLASSLVILKIVEVNGKRSTKVKL